VFVVRYRKGCRNRLLLNLTLPHRSFCDSISFTGRYSTDNEAAEIVSQQHYRRVGRTYLDAHKTTSDLSRQLLNDDLIRSIDILIVDVASPPDSFYKPRICFLCCQ